MWSTSLHRCCVLACEQVKSRGDFWEWLRHTVLPGVYYERYYDGQWHDFLDGVAADNNVSPLWLIIAPYTHLQRSRAYHAVHMAFSWPHFGAKCVGMSMWVMSCCESCVLMQGHLIGELRLRQARVTDGRCEQRVRRVTEFTRCQPGYSLSNEDQRDYMMGWRQANSSGMLSHVNSASARRSHLFSREHLNI